MEKKFKTRETVKSIDALVTEISGQDILSINQMLHIRGGEGDPNGPIILPPEPKK